eukprot:4255931-Pleurochrysis_carterae.AAC.1
MVALDREAPFGGEGRVSGSPLILSSEGGTQGRSHVRARLFATNLLWSGLEMTVIHSDTSRFDYLGTL